MAAASSDASRVEMTRIPIVAGSLIALCTLAQAAVSLYQSRQLTPAGEYTFNIDGPAGDAAGTSSVVNIARPGTRERSTIHEKQTQSARVTVGVRIIKMAVFVIPSKASGQEIERYCASES